MVSNICGWFYYVNLFKGSNLLALWLKVTREILSLALKVSTIKLTVSFKRVSLDPAIEPEISRTQTKSIGALDLFS